MAPVTELATIPLTPGAQIEDPTSPAGQVWQSSISTISSQPGFQRAHWGRELENESVLQLFIGNSLHTTQALPIRPDPIRARPSLPLPSTTTTTTN